ncbi:hypothetical protein L2U69_08995 [Zavarzinia compransoris]|uniref:NACHT domain-containing protein n=1 Tax=Zavarzinia marina TaxID=2911065 RepID=UPI001F3365DF|nr:hypothetical protein [Zavarzinia marina]MCF4165777.1 hypothetical protein [Zavarzinia marina]
MGRNQERGAAFENKVRQFAAIRFAHQFRSEHLSGINFDCVASPKSDYKIIIEATIENRLEKIRGLIARLQIAKQKMISEGIYAEVYIVLDTDPTNFMIEGAKAAKIQIDSFSSFYRHWFDNAAYIAARKKRPFGSAFKEGSDGPDSRPYVPVLFDGQDGKRYEIKDIALKISHGSRVILVGEFGTGKSRAIQQLFDELLPQSPTDKTALSIDLRTMWGTQNADEVLRRHFSMLQMSQNASSAIDALHHDDFVLLLDGFDELAIQDWGNEAGTISKSRNRTMDPVRDLLNRTKSGALITGRSHYFSSDKEMLSALGLNNDALIISTPPEFTISETKQFLKDMGRDVEIPNWLPRKPLVAEMFAEFSDIALSNIQIVNRPAFWEMFIDQLCERDSRIRQSYDSEALKKILCKLSRKARATADGRGPITPFDVQTIFGEVVGQLPAQEASAMLQRLPGLGRVASETDDRQFVDDFIVEGLRGLDVANILALYEQNVQSDHWKHGAGVLGLEIIANRVGQSFSISDATHRIQSERGESGGPLSCDIVGGLLLCDINELDFSGSEVVGGYVSVLDFSSKNVMGLHIESCEIKFLNIFNSSVVDVKISNSTIEYLEGASGDETPEWLQSCIVADRLKLDTVARIKRTELSPSQILLVTILRKTFLQPGSGRKEEALLRGLGEFGDAKLQSKVLSVLIKNRFLTEAPGRSGKLFVPERSMTSRVKAMMSKLQQSDDEVWREISKL